VFHRALNVAGRTRFWLLLANEYGLDRGGLKRAVRAFVESSIKVADLRAEQRLAEATAPRAAALFAKIAAGPDGLPALVALRGDLLTLVLEPLKAASSKPDHAAPSNDKPAGVTTTAFQVRRSARCLVGLAAFADARAPQRHPYAAAQSRKRSRSLPGT